MADFNGVMPAQPEPQPSYLQQISQLFAKKPAIVPPPAPGPGPTQATVDQSAMVAPATGDMSAMGIGIPMGGAVNLNKSKRTTTTDTPVYAKPADQEARMDAIRQTPELQQAQKDEGDMRAQIQGLIDKQNNRSTIDLSPLLAYADSRTGGHQAAAYKKPEDLTPEIIKGMQGLAAGDTGTLKAIHEAMANQQVGTSKTTSESDSEVGTKGTSGAANSSALKWHQQLTGDKDIKSANDAIDASNKLQGLMAENTSMSNLMAKIQTLRASGLNRVTNFEISQMGGDQALTARANQALQTLKSGNFTEQNKQELIDAANVLAQAAPMALQHKYNEYNTLGAMAGVPELGRKKVLNEAFFRNQPGGAQQPAAYDGSTPPAANATPEQKAMRLQFLQKKAQGG